MKQKWERAPKGGPPRVVCVMDKSVFHVSQFQPEVNFLPPSSQVSCAIAFISPKHSRNVSLRLHTSIYPHFLSFFAVFPAVLQHILKRRPDLQSTVRQEAVWYFISSNFIARSVTSWWMEWSLRFEENLIPWIILVHFGTRGKMVSWGKGQTLSVPVTSALTTDQSGWN